MLWVSIGKSNSQGEKASQWKCHLVSSVKDFWGRRELGKGDGLSKRNKMFKKSRERKKMDPS